MLYMPFPSIRLGLYLSYIPLCSLYFGYTNQPRQSVYTHTVDLARWEFFSTQELAGIDDGCVQQSGQGKDQSEGWGEEMLEWVPG